MKRLDAVLTRQPDAALALSLVLLGAVGILHRFTGHRLNLDFFYIVPAAVAARFCGRKASVLVCGLAAAVWFLDDIWSPGPDAPLSVPWKGTTLSLANSAMTLAVLLTVALSTARLKEAFEVEQRLAKVKSEMISLVSHQFNNALSVMGMAVMLLEEARGRAITDRDREMTDLLRRHLGALKRTVENFLNEARLSTGRLALEQRRIDAVVTAKAVLDAMSPVAAEKRLKPQLDAPAGGVPVVADPDALHLVLTNLISNAIKYTPEGGSVKVHIGRLDGAVEVCVRDSGIGMSKEEQSRALKGFTRTSSGRKAASGFGIGLKLADEMLRAQGSRLSVSSSPGKGSTFSFLLSPAA